MFLGQAALQFELWTGKPAPKEIMRRVLDARAMNLVLVGYRGTGKSVIARRLARRLGWPVVSLDDEIVRWRGKRIPESGGRARLGPFSRPGRTDLPPLRRPGWPDPGLRWRRRSEREANAAALRAHGRVFWLRATPATIAARIGATPRPR